MHASATHFYDGTSQSQAHACSTYQDSRSRSGTHTSSIDETDGTPQAALLHAHGEPVLAAAPARVRAQRRSRRGRDGNERLVLGGTSWGRRLGYAVFARERKRGCSLSPVGHQSGRSASARSRRPTWEAKQGEGVTRGFRGRSTARGGGTGAPTR